MKFLQIEKYLKDKYNLKTKEISKISLLFFFSFFLGFFIAFYFVPANSEFVKYFGSKELPYAYILSGIVGYFITLLYSRIQKKRKSKTLFIGALLILLSIALTSRLLLLFLELNQGIISSEYYHLIEKWLSFFVFIWAWPFIAFVSTITGGISLRLLNLIQVKKYYGIINLGGVTASIMGYFSIPLILRYITHHYDLILIGSIGIIISGVILFRIYKKFPEENVKKAPNSKSSISFSENIKGFFKKKFFYLIFLSAIFSTIAIYISDYGFLITIKELDQVFRTQEDISTFIAIVFGGLKIGEFIISVLSGRILGKGGVKLGLIILPISVTILIIFAFLSGELIGVIGIVFLIFITLTKSLERILRRGLDDPAFNVLYQTLPEDKKLYVQTKVGVVQQISIAIAGLVLLFINFILTKDSGFKLSSFPLYVLPFLILWIFIAFRLYIAYKKKIIQILAEKRMFTLEYKEKDIFATDVLQKHILSEDINSAKFSVVILSETTPMYLENYASFLLKIDDTIIRKSILKNIDSTYDKKLSKIIEEVGNKIGFKEKELRKLILRALYNLDYSEIENINAVKFNSLISSEKKRDKLFIAKYLNKNTVKNDEIYISDLLESKDKAIKLAAIKIAGKRGSFNLNQKLILLLHEPENYNLLLNVLIKIGDDILLDLDDFFKQQVSTSLLLIIIQIYAKIGTFKATKLLISHINHPNREIQFAVIQALHYADYEAKDDAILAIKQKIKDIVENILWIYVSIKDIVKQKNTLKLIQSLDLEREKSFDVLFILLSYIHPPETIELIKTNIVGENIIFALELIDNFISPDLKQIIIPLFEKMSLGNKIKKLRPYFYHKEKGFKERLNDILLKDYKKIDYWSKTKTIELIGKNLRNDLSQEDIQDVEKEIKPSETWSEKEANRILQLINKKEIPDELFVCLYHPAEIIYSTAAKEIFKLSPILCENYLKTFSLEKRKLIPLLKQNKDLLLDKVKLLKRVYLFYTIPEKSLLKLARITTFIKKKKDETIHFVGQDGTEDIIILIKGRLKFIEKKKEIHKYKRNDVIIKGLNIPQYASEVVVEKNVYAIVVSRVNYFNLLVTDKQLILHLFNRMKF